MPIDKESFKQRAWRLGMIFLSSFVFVTFATTVEAQQRVQNKREFVSPVRDKRPIHRMINEIEVEADNADPQTQADKHEDCELSSIFTPEIQRWGTKICEWSKQHELHPDLIATVMQIESCGNHLAVSATGVRGLFQVTGANLDGEDPFDPNVSMAKGPGKVLKNELKAAREDVIAAMAGYNGGAYARKYMGGEISRNQFYWYLRNHNSRLWWSHAKASAKVNEVEYYAQWANIYSEAAEGDMTTLNKWLDKGGDRLCRQASRIDIQTHAQANELASE